ncbi:MAG: glycosyltransferase family 4 protein [Vulcanimicrobiota bacterium]
MANTSWYLYNFRLPLARRLRQEGLEVVFVSPPDRYVEHLTSEGFRWVGLHQLNRRSVNPLRELFAFFELLRIYQQEKPQALHHFTVKCVLYGTIAAKLCGIRSVVNAVTGLGHIFLGNSWPMSFLRPIIRWFYGKILKARRVHVVFQNPDDLETFVDADLVLPEKTVLIRSSGVCTKKFCPRPGSDPELPDARAPVILFASRLLKEKGVYDLVEAARIVKNRRSVCFKIAGDPDPGNPTAVPVETLEEWRREGAVDLLGHVDTVAELIQASDIVVLPSYREGTPRILLEAAAMGKAMVATDVPGCREVVVHDLTGLLVPVRDGVALAAAIEYLLDHPLQAADFGKNARKKIVEEFSVEKVVDSTVGLYQKMGIV